MKLTSLLLTILTCITAIGCDGEPTMSEPIQMYATVELSVEPYRQVSVDASGTDVQKQVQAMSWTDLSAVKVVAGPDLYLEGSGSHEDGFSMIYREGQREFITSDDPSYTLMSSCLQKFAKGDGSWKTDAKWEFYQQWRKE